MEEGCGGGGELWRTAVAEEESCGGELWLTRSVKGASTHRAVLLARCLLERECVPRCVCLAVCAPAVCAPAVCAPHLHVSGLRAASMTATFRPASSSLETTMPRGRERAPQ